MTAIRKSDRAQDWRRRDLVDRLTAAVNLAAAEGWEDIAASVFAGAADRLERLSADELAVKFDQLIGRLDAVDGLLDGRCFVNGVALTVIDDLFDEVFDPLRFAEREQEDGDLGHLDDEGGRFSDG